MAVLISGTPGVGKTTVATKLAEILGAKYISVREIVLKKRLYYDYDKERESYIVDIDKTKRVLESILTCSEIVDTHLIEAIPPSKIKTAIILRLNPLILYKRLENRGYPEKKIKENVEAEILDVILVNSIGLFGYEKVYEIDTSGKEIKEIIDEILKILKLGKGPKPGQVDWLNKYDYMLKEE